MKKRTLLLIFIALSTITAFAQNVPSYVPSNGLVGWWPFNGNANDESGNGNHGMVNGATLTNDRFGNANMAYSFDGSTNYIEVPSTSGVSFSTTYSISAWFSADIWSFPAPIDQHAIVSKIADGDWYGGYEIRTGGAGFIMHSGNIGSNFDIGAGGYSAMTWHHVVVTFNGSIVKSYINGQQVDSAIRSVTIQTSSIPLRFGRRGGAGTYNNWFDGNIDDIAIWNRALTQCEIQDLYHAQLNSASMNISAGADQSICGGDPVTLNGSGGSTYQWNNNVIDGQAFTPNQSANYVLNGTDSLGCQGTDTVVVTVLENAVSTLTQTALDSYTLNGQTYTQSGTYTQTVPASNGCDSTITLNLTLNFTGMDELGTGAKKLVKITDLNGKIIPRRKNTLMLFIYEDGTVERVVEMEE